MYVPFISSSLVGILIEISGGVGGGGGAGGVPLFACGAGVSGGAGAIGAISGRVVDTCCDVGDEVRARTDVIFPEELVVSPLLGFRPAGKIIWGYCKQNNNITHINLEKN